MPSLAQCERFMRAIGEEYRDPCQQRMLRELCEHRYNIVKGPRQNTGKTHVCSWFIATDLALGYSTIVGMPTLEQGSRILIDRIDVRMSKFEQLPNIGVTRARPDNVRHKRWSNGAVLATVSMHETGDDARGVGKAVQGYTARNIFIDEAHECGPDIFEKLRPVVNVARKAGVDTIGLIGVGGYPGSLISIKHDDPTFHYIHVTPEEMIEGDPSYKEFFAEIEASESPETWRRHYLCEDGIVEGSRMMFARLTDDGGLCDNDFDARLHGGIDVGKQVDKTVVMITKKGSSGTVILERRAWTGTDYPEQVKEIAAYLDTWAGQGLISTNVGYEANGPGEVVGSYLKQIRPWGGLRRIFTTDQKKRNKPSTGRKSKWLKALVRDCARGKMACIDPVVTAKLKTLVYTILATGEYVWPHDDDLSALWINKAVSYRACAV